MAEVLAAEAPFGFLDIGCSKVSCAIAVASSSARPAVMSAATSPLFPGQGLAGAINRAVADAESVAGIRISKACVSFSGFECRSHLLSSSTAFSSCRTVVEDDIFKCSKRLDVKGSIDCDRNVILHVIPARYVLDGERAVADPIGKEARELKILYHIVTADRDAYDDAAAAVSECNLEIEDAVSPAYAGALAVLSEAEKRAGAMLLDIGKSRLTAGIFAGGNFIHGFEMPIAGDYVTGRLCKHMEIGFAEAERLKLKYGAAPPEAVDFSEYANAADAEGAERSFSKADVLNVVRPVMGMVFEVVRKYVADNDFSAFVKRVALTGGGANMAGISGIASEVFGLPARVGAARRPDGTEEKYALPEYAALFGLVMFSFTRAPAARRYWGRSEEGHGNGAWGRLKKFVRDNF
ncbi:MAG: cell division protein FtsA [Rickettsiales bacterium]|jgi:cell division protein FtsA|nr:cell division protein FtsA [Rickettsiales bacterium]